MCRRVQRDAVSPLELLKCQQTLLSGPTGEPPLFVAENAALSQYGLAEGSLGHSALILVHNNRVMPGDVSGRSIREGERVGMARTCRGMRVFLWFLCLSDSFLSVMDIFSGFIDACYKKTTAAAGDHVRPVEAAENI